MKLLYCLAVAATMASGALAANRERVAFISGSDTLVGYHYTPANQSTGPVPIVLIAHGLGGLQSSRLQPFAEAFADAGYQAMTFDYRYWGESGGTPRNIIAISKQQEDYLAAVRAVKQWPTVSRVIVWGTSLSGGHVLELGEKYPDMISGVIAQAPFVNGPAAVAAIPPKSIPRLAAKAAEDTTFGRLAWKPVYIPIANKTGELGALTQAGAYEGYQFVQPTSPPPGNVLDARFIIALPLWRPDSSAWKTRLPTFLGIAKMDNITPPDATYKLVAKMATVTVLTVAGGHFDVYPGAMSYQNMLNGQLAFLSKNFPLAK